MYEPGRNLCVYFLLFNIMMKGKGKGMEYVKKGLDNQAVGLLPLLLFIFLDNYFSYLVSFLIGFAFCFICLFLFQVLLRDKVYQFMLLPSAATLILFAGFLCLKLEPVLFIYSPLITEILLVVVLTLVGFTRRTVIRRVRDSKNPRYKRTLVRTTLNEFYFVSQLTQNIYTLHLFGILVYSIMPDAMHSPRLEQFIYRDLGIVIGLAIMTYEQIRLSLMRGSLRKEMWLPVLNEQGKVTGCMARSVSRSLAKKYYHPIVRIAVMYRGMLYLVKRSSEEYVSPGTLDYPFHGYVLFHHSIENTVKEMIGPLAADKRIAPRFLIRYTFEDEKVKHLVSLYVVNLGDEALLEQIKRPTGKLWTPKQIEENLASGIFSSYFEKEFPYLQNTVLLAERFSCEKPSEELSGHPSGEVSAHPSEGPSGSRPGDIPEA